ncbi:MAG TPA: FecR family protein [Pseudomonadales bacterium]|nr:FecR family protein [Pseudomonadales bacterium]
MIVHPRCLLQAFAAGACLLLAMSLSAAEPVGRVLLARGDVTATDVEGTARALRRRDSVSETETLATGPGSRLQVRFDDGAMLELRADSRVDLSVYRYARPDEGENRVLLDVLAGGVRAITGAIGHADPSAVELQTPVASIGIRGTHFSAVAEAKDVWVFGLWEGGIRVANRQGVIDLGRDADFRFARAVAGQAPIGLVAAPSTFAEAPAGGGDGEEAAAAPPAAAVAAGAAPAEAGPAPSADSGGGEAVATGDAVRVNRAESVSDAEDIAEIADDLLGGRFPLSDRERVALAAGAEQGLLVSVGGRLVRGSATTGDDGGAVVLFDLPDGSTGLFRAGDAVPVDARQTIGGLDVSWGTFLAGSEGLRVFVDDGETLRSEALGEDVTLLRVASASLADLNVDAAFAGTDVLGTTSAGEITRFGVFFDASLDLGSGLISDGRLLLEAAGGVEEYRVMFDGAVTGGVAELGVTGGTITGSGITGTLDVDRDLSVLQGLFTDKAEGFAGGFSLQEAGNADRFARGVFAAGRSTETGAGQAPPN